MQLFPSPELGMFGRRQRDARGYRIPVVIETGVVPQGLDTAMVADEFGAGDVAPLPGRCACCTVRVRLQDRLRQMIAARAQGKIAHFSRIAIQTNEDIGPIRRTFASPRALESECWLEKGEMQIPDGASCFTLSDDRPIDWEAFSRFVTTLLRLRGSDLFSAKGMLDVEGCRGPLLVQFEQHLAHRPAELLAWPDGNRHSEVTFIMRNAAEREIRALFDAVRALAPTSA